MLTELEQKIIDERIILESGECAFDDIKDFDKVVADYDPVGTTTTLAFENNDRYFRMVAEEDHHQTTFPVITEGLYNGLVW